MKKLGKGEVRFIAKELRDGPRTSFWRVYDRANGSYPYINPELGQVLQDVTKEEAELEAVRLNELVGIAPGAKVPELTAGDTAPRKRKSAPPKKTERVETTPTAAVEELEIIEFDLPDYGIMSKDERAKYEDGLIEKVTY